jgi:hypothetical protein
VTGTISMAVGYLNKERLECKGSFPCSVMRAWRNVDAAQRVVCRRSQISVLVTFGCFVRQAQLIGESCGGKVNVGKQKQLVEDAMRKVGQEDGGFMIVNGETMAVDNSVLFSPPHVA